MNVGLMAMLHEYIKFNNIVINKKAKIFDIALWVCLAYVVLIILSIIFKLI